MSDIGRYNACFDSAKEYEARGNHLMAAIEYWMCAQYGDHGELPVLPDVTLASKALLKAKKLQAQLPYAPISKTTFIKGCQCIKALWLYRNKYDQRYVSPDVLQKFKVGHIIGELAQHLFPGGYDASLFPEIQKRLEILNGHTPLQIPNLPYRIRQNLWLQQTKGAIDQNVQDIYEAAFTYDDVFAAVDILHKSANGYVAYEVKSSYDVKDVYIHDCALQYYVMSHNIDISEMFLVYPDEEYAQSLGIDIDKLTIGNCDIERLFIEKSIIGDVLAMQEQIKAELKEIKPILSKMKEPKIEMGEHCSDPYDCDFQRYCKSENKGWFSFLK